MWLLVYQGIIGENMLRKHEYQFSKRMEMKDITNQIQKDLKEYKSKYK